MKIVRFSTPKDNNHHFTEQKISLAKLSQVKPQPIVVHAPQIPIQSIVSPKPALKKSHVQSHIKWVEDPAVTGAILNQVKNIVTPPIDLVSPKCIPRRKIFQEKSTSFKENYEIPTFSKVPSVKNIYDQDQTHYYSMVVNSPKQGAFHHMVGSRMSESKEYQSPFVTNEDNTRFDCQNALMMNSNSIQKSSITELTEFHIPRLEQKLKDHDNELLTIKKYLKNTEEINMLKEEIKDFETQSFVEKQNQIEMQKSLLMLSIQEARAKERAEMKKHQDEVESRIEKIQQERLRRLEKMQRENERLYQNLKHYSHEEGPQFESNPHEDYHFQGPVAFPSKDWESEREISAPPSTDYHRQTYKTQDFKKNRSYNSRDMEISPILKKQVHEISSIGFSNNKTQSFSMEANTFRQIMSPLEFQGENETW